MTILDPGGVSRQLFSDTPARPSPAENGGYHRATSFNDARASSANTSPAARAPKPSLSTQSWQSGQMSSGSYKAPIDEQRQPQHSSGRHKHVASFRVPSDSDSDAEEGDSDVSSSRHQAASMASRLHPVLAATSGRMRSVQREFAAAQEACRAYLAGPMQDIAEDLAVKMQDIILHVDARKAQLQGSSAQARAQHQTERQRRLDDLQQRQQQTQEQQERKIAEAKRAADEAAAREAAEQAQRRREQQQEQQRQQEEAARRLKQQEARRQAEQQQQQQQQNPQQQVAAQPQAAAATVTQPKQPAPSIAGPAPGIVVRAAASAAAYEKALAAKLEVAEAAAKELSADATLKQQRRTLEKRITLLVSQISGTTLQVEAKAKDLISVIHAHSGRFRTLACLTLAARVVSQCEGQIARISSFAFPVAMVVVQVAASVPEVMELLLARLHKACILTVPKYYGWRPSGGTTQEQYFELLGYQQVDDAKAPGGKRMESEDEFVGRMSAYVLLYAAIVQVEVPPGVAHPYPLEHGWMYIAQLLNSLQPNRVTASALMAFLTHAGYRLHQQYGRQFVKLLHAVHDNFLPDLEAKGDSDARAVMSRLNTYLHSQEFTKPPAGRTLRRMDESSYARA